MYKQIKRLLSKSCSLWLSPTTFTDFVEPNFEISFKSSFFVLDFITSHFFDHYLYVDYNRDKSCKKDDQDNFSTHYLNS